ncbi:hypothetical protein DET54_1045 [Paenibacillus pabuli]|uniref:Uncharacterized protein n=1 Tax=Paenibacillus pabuli TaxID=1472 RepID=A0ABX9BLR9_9BACL|nr:hypothetical protein [Paenibacillus pabuli]RAI97950.1 hypothetical protein DET54_1045 [Paenibacillus pabuli]
MKNWLGLNTKDALLGLQFRLQHNVLTMENIAQDAEAIIAHHQELLTKGKAHRSNFHGKVAQVETAVNLVYGLKTAVVTPEEALN